MNCNRVYIRDQTNFRVLFENTVMILGNIFENSYCYNKLTKEEFPIFQFHFDPSCGVIGKNNDWCLVGGEVLVIRTWFDNTVRLIDDIKQIHSIKLINEYSAQILTDPWTDNSEIWEITIDIKKVGRPISLIKVRDFTEYIDKPYSDKINW